MALDPKRDLAIMNGRVFKTPKFADTRIRNYWIRQDGSVAAEGHYSVRAWSAAERAMWERETSSLWCRFQRWINRRPAPSDRTVIVSGIILDEPPVSVLGGGQVPRAEDKP